MNKILESEINALVTEHILTYHSQLISTGQIKDVALKGPSAIHLPSPRNGSEAYCGFRNQNMTFRECCDCWSANRHRLDLRDLFHSRNGCTRRNRGKRHLTTKSSKEEGELPSTSR